MGGARSLPVAPADEAASLRASGIGGRVLIMGALSDEELPVALDARADVVAWSDRFVDALLSARTGAANPVRVHVKFDTGMGRLGTREFDEAIGVAERV